LGFSGGPTYVPAIFLLSAKPNKMAEDRTAPTLFKFGVISEFIKLYQQ
jgi:hypothetical protein